MAGNMINKTDNERNNTMTYYDPHDDEELPWERAERLEQDRDYKETLAEYKYEQARDREIDELYEQLKDT